MQKKHTHPYQKLYESLISWQRYTPTKDTVSPKPFFILLTHPHCMWTEKLRNEAFKNPHIAELIQKHFTPCILDAHIDPELYLLMNQALSICLKEQNIRPGCIFLHHTGIPYFAGGYHPPSPKYGMPSFLQFLHHAIKIQKEPSDLHRIMQRHNTPQKISTTWCYSWDIKIDRAYEHAFDFMNHGFGFAPKYLNIARLRAWYTFEHRQKSVRDTVLAIATSPMLDPINGCLYRKCEDALWEIPVREASLFEQAEFLSLMMQTHPKEPCIAFLIEKIHNQYSLSNGLYANSISYNPPYPLQSGYIQWNEAQPYFPTLPTRKACSELSHTNNPNVASRDPRSILSANARYLSTLVEHHAQQPSQVIKSRIQKLEEAIWEHFGWSGKKVFFHTTTEETEATGLDMALLIQSILALQEWSPAARRHQQLLDILAYWEERYLDQDTCYTHPKQRYFVRGIDMVADNTASTQEEAAHTLAKLQHHGISTRNTAHAFIQRQQWIAHKNPKLLSSIIHAWKRVPSPFSQYEPQEKATLVFSLHDPQSHRIHNYTKNMDITRWAQSEDAKNFLTQCGYTDIRYNPQNWVIRNQKGQTHVGDIYSEDLAIFLGPPPSSRSSTVETALRVGDVVYIHSTYQITQQEKQPHIQSETPIRCFCSANDGTIWWMTDTFLYSTQSDTPYRIPVPLSSPVSMTFFQGSLLIADRQGLWIFHLHQERFGRYAGRNGATQQDGSLQEAVFLNITAICTYASHILISDAYTLRVIDTQQGIVQTLDIETHFVYATSIAMSKKHIYIVDFIGQCIWKHSLEEENSTVWSCATPKNLFHHHGELFAFCDQHIVHVQNALFTKNN